MKNKLPIIIQADMKSGCEDGGVMAGLCGYPIIEWIVNRCESANYGSLVMVATGTRPKNEELIDYCTENDIRLFCGSDKDILSRYVSVTDMLRADACVRVSATCPLLDPTIIDRCIVEYVLQMHHPLYVSNIHPIRTFPYGMDVEVIRKDELDLLAKEGDPKDIHGVTHSTRFKTPKHPRIGIICPEGNYSDLRICAEEQEDIVALRYLLEAYADTEPEDIRSVTWNELVHVLEMNPEIKNINRKVDKTVEVESDANAG